jgi:alanine racemase
MTEIACPDDRWAWVEIDLSALKKNVRAFRAQIDPRVRMMCVVKADAYGHGAVRCAKEMAKAGAQQFAVATVKEGVELRRAGVEEPILMLAQPPVTAVDTLVGYDIMPSVYTSDFALAFGEAAAAAGKAGKYHLAIDSGMNRIGVRPEDAVEFRRSIDFHRGLECAGTFTHFATADVPDDWDFVLQARRFSDTVHALKAAGFSCGLVHCDNTPGTILHKELQMDMCRVGVGLYGMQPAESTAPYISLEPVMSVKARITRVTMPEVGEGVGYGMTYRIPYKGTQIATVNIGYADGLSRLLSNNMDVLVHGKRCAQVGKICMDQFMFAADAPGAHTLGNAVPLSEGDVVTVLGRDGQEEITADEMADRRHTINYEVTCDFGLRLEKLYV